MRHTSALLHVLNSSPRVLVVFPAEQFVRKFGDRWHTMLFLLPIMASTTSTTAVFLSSDDFV